MPISTPSSTLRALTAATPSPAAASTALRRLDLIKRNLIIPPTTKMTIPKIKHQVTIIGSGNW